MCEVARPVVCPFCGLVSEVPHAAQTDCIEALRQEVERTRRLVEGTAARRDAGDPDLELT